ncbi:MAG: ORF6N domain-containing protein [Candidatus Rokubacteria bacterium]|nr:ORF6N domain-containing protein [Candidatus Rokubacteria bacterium]
MASQRVGAPADRIHQAIVLVRGHRVMLDADLAALYEVPTKVLLQAVRRNSLRFPRDFMFRLSGAEAAGLRSQIVTSNAPRGRGGRRYAPYAFTEQGVAMLSSVLRSQRAIKVNISIMRAFVKLRRIVVTQEDLRPRLDALEKKYDANFKVVFNAIREMMTPFAPARSAIGFRPRQDRGGMDSQAKALRPPRRPTC